MATNSRALIKLLTGFRRPFMCTVAWYTSHMETLVTKASDFFCCGRAPPLAAPREVPTKRGTRSGSRHTRSAVSLEPDVLGGNAVVAAAPPNRTAHCHLSITTLPDTHYKSRKTPKEKGYPKKKSICSGSREKNGNRISEYHKKTIGAAPPTMVMKVTVTLMLVE